MKTKFLEFLLENKIYTNVDNTYENEKFDYYQVPFSLFKSNVCIKDDYDWVLCFGDKLNFVYDYISDEEIKKHLHKDLSNIDITVDWTSVPNNKFKFETAYEDIEKHSLRIAKLVQEIKNGNKIKPISMLFDDRAFQYGLRSYIEDGNHRIRALQFLKYDYFPAVITGNYSKYLIEYLKDKNF